MPQVSERARKVSAATLLGIPDVPWKRVKGMRDWIAHAFGNVDPVTLEDVVSRQLPSLIGAVRAALEG